MSSLLSMLLLDSAVLFIRSSSISAAKVEIDSMVA
jgi:hypothetical protein